MYHRKVTEEEKVKLRSVIRRLCLTSGKYEGHKKTIVKCGSKKFPWVIEHQCDLFGKSSEFYENLNDAVYDFVELWAVYG